MRSDVSASVEFTFVRKDDAGKMATLAAVLGAEMVMERDPESQSQIVRFIWRNRDLSHQIAAFTACAALQDRRTPENSLEEIRALLGRYGFDFHAQIDPSTALVEQRRRNANEG